MKIFRLPDVAEGLAEATIVEWHVQAGDTVQADQALLSIETAKAVVEIPAPHGGRITALLAKAGDTIPTHAPLVEFADEVRSPSENQAQNPAEKKDNGSVVGTLADSTTVRHESFVIGRHRHTEARLQQTRSRRQAREGVSESTAKSRALFAGGEPLDNTRRAMAEHLARAHRDVVQVTLTLEAEIIFADRHTLTARLAQALVAAARIEPALNAWYDGARQMRQLNEQVHIGIAVDTPQGLFVPVLENAQNMEATAIAREVVRLKQMAEAHQLTPAQMRGATLTLSNFGALAGHFATPLVTPPQVAILGAGHASDELKPDGEGYRRVRLLPLSLSFDHRAVTGGEAARFLDAVAADLARP